MTEVVITDHGSARGWDEPRCRFFMIGIPKSSKSFSSCPERGNKLVLRETFKLKLITTPDEFAYVINSSTRILESA